jgi:RimJ/RimL family protein N-acetyltransferase
MNVPVKIKNDLFPDLLLRNINELDQDHLRNWKNENNLFFFYKGIITSTDQMKWYCGYLSRENDFMFIVTIQSRDIGCMGIRCVDDKWDIYNVILGDNCFKGKGYMSMALTMMCSFALLTNRLPITAKVLCLNPAIDWYKKNSFQIAHQQDDYYEIVLDQQEFTPCPLNITF